MEKKSAYKTIAEAIAFGGLKNFKVSTKSADTRKLTVDEIKQIVKEEFEAAKDITKTKLEEPPGGWGDADLEKQIDWVEKLDLKEFFKK
jgi:hypothetical protein